jgi:RNA polymerase sigma factor (sigma-70 family)
MRVRAGHSFSFCDRPTAPGRRRGALAFSEIYRRTMPMVLQFIRRGLPSDCRNDAEDLVQEVFLRAWACADCFQEGCAHETWLCAIARHVVIDHHRRRATYTKHLVRRTSDICERVALDFDEVNGVEDLGLLVPQLPIAQRQAFELVHIRRLPMAEAAICAQCSRQQLRNRLYEARRRLSGWLGISKRK